MTKTCRTCTQPITADEYFCIDGSSFASSTLQIKDLLLTCLPELDVHLNPNLAICRNCASALHIAYEFKMQTLRNEEALRGKQGVRAANVCVEEAPVGNISHISECKDDEKVDVTIADTKLEPFDSIELHYEDINNVAEIVEIESDNVEYVIESDCQKNENAKTNVESEECKDSDVEIIMETEEVSQVTDEQEGGTMQYPALVPLNIVKTKQHTANNVDDKAETCPPLLLLDNVRLLNRPQPRCYRNVKLVKCPPLVPLCPTVEHDGAAAENNQNINKNDETGNVEVDIPRMESMLFKRRQKRNVLRPYKCSECTFCSDSRAALIMHRRIHTGEKPFQCPICPHKSKRKSHLESHLTMHSEERVFKCLLCDTKFKAERDLRKHALVHSAGKPFKCSQCDFRSRHKDSVQNHVKRIHSGAGKSTKPDRCMCCVCGKTLGSAATLKVHMRIHTGVKPLLCELCGKHFREMCNLRNHMNTHTGEKIFKCTQCDYTSFRKANLEAHMRLYADHLELVSCPICDRQYASQYLMVRHVHEDHKIKDFQVPRHRNRKKALALKKEVKEDIDEETDEGT